MTVDVENDFFPAFEVSCDKRRGGHVFEGGDLHVGVSVLNLRQVPEHKLRCTLVVVVSEKNIPKIETNETVFKCGIFEVELILSVI